MSEKPAWYEDIWTIPVVGPILWYIGYFLVFVIVGSLITFFAAMGVLPVIAIAALGFVAVLILIYVVQYIQTTAPERRARRERERVAREEEARIEREQMEMLRMHTKATERALYKDLRTEIMATRLYAKWRDDVLKEYGRACMVCGSMENIEVDHRYKSFYAIIKQYRIQDVVQAYECRELWDVSNGAPLCKNHHSQTKSSIAYNNLS